MCVKCFLRLLYFNCHLSKANNIWQKISIKTKPQHPYNLNAFLYHIDESFLPILICVTCAIQTESRLKNKKISKSFYAKYVWEFIYFERKNT